MAPSGALRCAQRVGGEVTSTGTDLFGRAPGYALTASKGLDNAQ